MTRARDFLYVTWPLRYYHRRSRYTDRHIYAQRSRFLTDQVSATFESVNLVHDLDEDAAQPSHAPRDIGAHLQSRWE